MTETVAQALARGRKLLASADVADCAVDARLLLQEALATDHATLIGEADRQLTADEVARYGTFLARRMAHEPVSKILGRREFFGRSFAVTADVLDPRADTETLIELALSLDLPDHPRLLELGSGSGALICTLLAELPDATGTAVDVSRAALAVTENNAAQLALRERLVLLEGSWFHPVRGSFDLIVSNPPYIPTGEIAGLDVDVRDHDPLLALDGGADGLDCYRLLARGAKAHLCFGAAFIVEIGAGQASDVTAIFAAQGYGLRASRSDLGGHVRALAFATPERVGDDGRNPLESGWI